jgi:hypothetical protein
MVLTGVVSGMVIIGECLWDGNNRGVFLGCN